MLINLFLCFKNLVDQIDKGISGAGGGNGSGSSTLDRSKLQPLNLSGLVYLIYNFLFYNHVEWHYIIFKGSILLFSWSSLLILGRASPSIPKKSKLPPRPDDYDDYWYQDDETGEWRNEYDDEGKKNVMTEFA